MCVLLTFVLFIPVTLSTTLSQRVCACACVRVVICAVMPLLEGSAKYKRVEDLPIFKGCSYSFLGTCMAGIIAVPLALIEINFPWNSKAGM